MTILVIQEQHFTTLTNGEVWVDKQSNREFWTRYLRVFDQVRVFARMSYANSVGNKALRSDRPEVQYYGIPDFRGISGIIRNYWIIQKALSKAIKQVDCIIFRAPSPISMVCYRLVAKSGKPFAVELMNNPKTHYSKEAMQKWYQPLVAHFIIHQTKKMCRRANGVSYVTDHVLQELYPSTARTNGESDSYFESSYSTIKLEEKDYQFNPWSERRPAPVVFVHSGEMVDYRKGQNIIIDTVSILKKKGYDIRALFIGGGDKRSEFEAYAAQNGLTEDVEFVGWKSGFSNVQQELLKGHFFLFPSRGEGLPRSIIEAMASGLLCFGSNIDGITELLDPENLVEEFSGEAFAAKIEPFLQDWTKSIRKREEQFQISKKYENSLLSMKRDRFYQKLAACVKRER